jgi:hypothetical protein
MAGSGASPNGNRPFLDLLDLDTKEAQRLWQSSPPYLEATGSIMSDANDVRGVGVCGAGVGLGWGGGRGLGWVRAGRGFE